MASGLVLHLAADARRKSVDVAVELLRGRRCCGLCEFAAGISSCLFHLDVAVQLLQDDLVRLAVEYQDAFFLIVVTLVALEHRVWHPRTI